MVFFESYGLDFHEIEFLKMLKERYVRCKGTHNEFEVIQISEKKEWVMSKHVGHLPWVVSDLLPVVDSELFSVHNSSKSYVFFDGDGNVVRKTIWPSFENLEFPYCADGVEREAWTQLGIRIDWKSWYRSQVPRLGRVRIYSLEKMNAPASLTVC